MTSASAGDLKELRAKYLGAVSASLSHEINNVLAIVGELSGLIDDLLAGAEAGRPLDPTRFKTIGEKISHHVARGKGYVGTLNRFAHSVDESWTSFDAGASVSAVVQVCDRFARLRKVELQAKQSEGWPQLEGSLSDFEHLVFRGIEAALATADREGAVTIELVGDHGAPLLEVVSSGPAAPVEQDELGLRLALVEALAEQLGVSVARPARPDRNLTLAFGLPRVLEARTSERSS